ncbi:MAG TPA: glycosyltransferase family 87 protein [Polyangia bacterium]|nr:glycosyltransferase family 87 protein [Polyangia bacterium]
MTAAQRPARFSWAGALTALNVSLAAALLIRLALHFRPGWRAETTDFTALRTGWWLALHDPRHLYDAAAQAAVQQRFMRAAGGPGFVNGLLAFLNPPHMALAGVWLAWLGDRGGGRLPALVWLACNVALLALLVVRVRDALRLTRAQTAAAATALAAFFPVFEALSQGQLSILLATAAFGVASAVDRDRPWQAAGWLLVLGFKPQLLPALAAALLARREWRTLLAFAALGAVVVAVTSALLGPRAWIDWATSVRALERSFGGGAAAAMPTLRGVVARALPHLSAARLEAVGLAIWLAGPVIVLLIVILTGGARAPGEPPGGTQRAIGLGAAVALLTSPHLYQHDLVVWIVPLVAALAAVKAHPAAPWRTGALLALAWPAWAMLAELADQSDGWPSRLPVDLRLVPLALCLVWSIAAARQLRAHRSF